jgi:hypothetical protein
MNQTALKGKNPQDLNPTGILSKSFESKETLLTVATAMQERIALGIFFNESDLFGKLILHLAPHENYVHI